MPLPATQDREESATAICEQLAGLVGADVLNAYKTDRETVDAILSRLAGSAVTVSYSTEQPPVI